jgi:hypothetical protein
MQRCSPSHPCVSGTGTLVRKYICVCVCVCVCMCVCIRMHACIHSRLRHLLSQHATPKSSLPSQTNTQTRIQIKTFLHANTHPNQDIPARKHASTSKHSCTQTRRRRSFQGTWGAAKRAAAFQDRVRGVTCTAAAHKHCMERAHEHASPRRQCVADSQQACPYGSGPQRTLPRSERACQR